MQISFLNNHLSLACRVYVDPGLLFTGAVVLRASELPGCHDVLTYIDVILEQCELQNSANINFSCNVSLLS